MYWNTEENTVWIFSNKVMYHVCLLYYFLIVFYLFLFDAIIHNTGKISTINNNLCKKLVLIFKIYNKKYNSYIYWKCKISIKACKKNKQCCYKIIYCRSPSIWCHILSEKINYCCKCSTYILKIIWRII